MVGVLARAQRLYQVACHDVVVMTNHWHGLLSVQDANQLARFMVYVGSNLAREVGRLADRRIRRIGWHVSQHRLAEESGEATPSRAELARKDRKRKRKGSNDDWTNAHDPD